MIYRRLKNKKSNEYIYNSSDGKIINDKYTLDRIKKLCIPPNWTSVEISSKSTDYLQATGKDDKLRTQYIYHPMWIEISKIEKYTRLNDFINKLPLLNKRVNNILNNEIKLDNKEYIIALMFKILSKTHARIGNDCYADENNTYGLTTLLKKHLELKNSTIKFSYIGKKGVEQNLMFKDLFISNILKKLLDIQGDRLFQTTNKEIIKSTDMNEFLKDTMGDDFTCKDFRTYGSNILFLKILTKKESPTSITASKKILNQVYDEVAQELGHTRAISKKSYVMPIISDKFLENPSNFIGKNHVNVLKNILKEYI